VASTSLGFVGVFRLNATVPEVALQPTAVVGHLDPGGGQPRPQRGRQPHPLPAIHDQDATVQAAPSTPAA
jgi:hypothetical protein